MRYEEALQHYDKALSLKPDYAEAYSNKGNTLNELKRYEEALQYYDKALSLKPDIDWALGNRLILKLQMCNWANLQRDINHLVEMNKSNNKIIQPFQLLPMIDNPQLHKRISEIYTLHKYPVNPELGNIHFSKQKKKIRLGYFSPDFRNHPVALLTAELFESHDRTLFEVIAFSLLQASDEDQIRMRLKNSFDKFLDVGHLSDIEIAKLAREMDIDIAIDLCGHTRHSRTGIFSFRAAPVQVSYLGYLGTMGANYIDYLLADKTIITKDLEECYTEKIIYLPSYQVNDSKKTISQKKFTREELGVSEDKIIYCCFNNNYKILPTTFESWMRILKEVDKSILFLYAESSVVEDNLIKEAKSRGIDSSRIVFGKRIKYEEYLERYKICDLFLDTLPYNAGTTASDALWAGLPVITLKGKSFASRVAASLLTAINLPELITSSQEEYELLAIKLGNNPNELIHLKQKIENTKLRSNLFDTVAFTDVLEKAYLEAYDRYLLGSAPDNIDLAKA
jgi:predicted O-linked N-acetylglucosamine transferase (SPINDLY family)